MSADSFTETTSQSWFGRLGNALKGILVGIVLFLIAIVVLWTNEGRSVKTYRALNEGSENFASVSAKKIDPANEGKLVHLSGMATTKEKLSDPAFKISDVALKLQRKVEMYQWQESKESDTKKKVGGGSETTTTYKYQKVWSGQMISSSKFNKPDGHRNPESMPYSSETWTTRKATLGDFRLSSSLLGKINQFSPLAPPADHALPADLQGKANPHSDGFYIGADPGNPAIGDLRISFQSVHPTDVSVVSAQVKDSFEPYRAKNGKTVELLQLGTHSAEAMFEKAQADNRTLTWILRAVGFVVMGIGISLVFKPLSVIADVLPFIGNLVEAGTGFIAFGIAAVLSMLTIAIAWVAYRPLLAIGLIAVAVVIAITVGMKLGKANARLKAQKAAS